MINIDNISKSYKTSEGIINALQNVSMTIPSESCTIISGENGSGKSVLMSIIAGLEKPDKGTIYFDGIPLKKAGKPAGLVFQEAETQILGETPREDIAFGLKNTKKNKAEIQKAINTALENTGLTKKADFPARFLSGGEKRRLAVACMISLEKPVIIFDEPYANLDYGGVRQVNTLIKQLLKDGKTVIILSHEIEKCLGLSQKFIVLFRGQKVFEGTPEEGVKQNLEQWNIRNPFNSYSSVKDLIW